MRGLDACYLDPNAEKRKTVEGGYGSKRDIPKPPPSEGEEEAVDRRSRDCAGQGKGAFVAKSTPEKKKWKNPLASKRYHPSVSFFTEGGPNLD